MIFINSSHLERCSEYSIKALSRLLSCVLWDEMD